MRLAIVGLGFMGSTHAKALEHVPGVELAAVVSSDASKGAGFLRYPDLASALADPTIDAVDLCLPTDLHEIAAREALRHGKHVLLEKPMALDGASCDRIREEARLRKKILMVAQVLRFFPAYGALESSLKDLGAVRAAAFRRRCAVPGWGKWLADRSRSGGGVFDLLIHDVDMALHLFGVPVFVSATGCDDMAAGIDTISAQLYFAAGFSVEIAGGWHHRGGFPFAMEYTVVTDGGVLDYNSESRPPTLHRPGGSSPLPLETADGYAAEIAYFAECCRTGAEPARCRPEESAAAVRLMLAMLEARKRNGEKLPWKLE